MQKSTAPWGSDQGSEGRGCLGQSHTVGGADLRGYRKHLGFSFWLEVFFPPIAKCLMTDTYVSGTFPQALTDFSFPRRLRMK